MEIATYLGDVRFLQTDLILAGMFQDERPPQGLAGLVDWYLFGQLTDLLLSGKFSGSPGDMALFATQGKVQAPKFLVVGMGKRDETTIDSLRGLWLGVSLGLRDMKAPHVAVEFMGTATKTIEPAAAAEVMLRTLIGDGIRTPAQKVTVLPADEYEQEMVEKLIR